ncbi:HEAT repeat domain-containing protein [Nannocystis bainbridge]|uniref:HEAT repeat domain-containing protein n=1 Tax=Nannocystis bainbridge TaxID=2995303 RepID=A0ABT5DP08_9BACT|nr:HEAT repeat domain-containing protein [Nannocystis bainbridge]MDC0715394.1 HEAT repeat domain-containing protein [Nannocystis bainbridge]
MPRIVIEDRVTRWKVSCFAADHGLVFYDKVPESDANPEEVIWASRDGATRLHRLEDRFAGLAYLILDGEEEASLTTRAIDELDGLSLATLLIALAADPDAARAFPVIAALGVLAPPAFEPHVFAVFSRLLADADPSLRGKALAAAAYPAWPEFVPLMTAMASDDPDPDVRERAAVAVAAFRRHLAGEES